MVYPLGLFSRKAVLCARSRLRLPIGARLSRPYKALLTLCFTGNSSQSRRLCRLAVVRATHTKKTPPFGDSVFLVYPLGLEPKLDGVGGRNVIQLHYEYIFYSLEPQGFAFSCTTNTTFFIFFLCSFQKAYLFYYFLLPFCKRLWYTIFKFKEFFFEIPSFFRVFRKSE